MIKINKKNITRIILLLCIIVFGILWIPESQSVQIGKYFLIGNLILLFFMMEILPLWFQYQYRTIITLLQYFSETYDKPLEYSYTPVILIRNNIKDDTHRTYLSHIDYQSEKTLFTIFHNNNLYEFITDITYKKHVTDLISVIIYYLDKEIPYEILHQHTKRLQHTL
jgi:hypothetical protein